MVNTYKIHGYCLAIICIGGVTVGPSETEYHKSMADPEEGASVTGRVGVGVVIPYSYSIYYTFAILSIIFFIVASKIRYK